MSEQAEDVMTMDEDEIRERGAPDGPDGKPAPDARKAATVIRDLLEFGMIDDLIRDFFAPAAQRTRDIIEVFAREQEEFCRAIIEHLDRCRVEGEAGAGSGTDAEEDPLERRLSA